jgi:site-specific recombinase XerD
MNDNVLYHSLNLAIKNAVKTENDQLPAILLTETTSLVPALIAARGPHAGRRFIEFFTANIRNPNTRKAYYRAASEFFKWCDQADLGLLDIEPVHVAVWVESLGHGFSPPSVKQWLAAVRMLFDWLVVGQVLAVNPAAAVRGPKHVVRIGKTPVLAAPEARLLLDSINTKTVIGLRDRALIGLLVFTFARIGAALGMTVADVFWQHRRLWVRLHEKGGKQHSMPCHHNLESYLQDYIETAGLAINREGPLFRTAYRRTKTLTDRRMTQSDAWRMLQRRAREAGIPTAVCNHTFRATGITAYLDNGGSLENAQAMAAHESPRTTKLYDRTDDQITLDEVEKIGI